MTDLGSGYQIQRNDGSVDNYTTAYTDVNGTNFCFLTSKVDPAGNQQTYQYATASGVFRLVSVTDPDGYQTKLYYGNATYPNLITRVEDPFYRTNHLFYDAAGYLTNIVDVAGLTNTFAYDAGAKRGWITNLSTPYGVTSFAFGGEDALNDELGAGISRTIEVTLPTGAKHLYLYQGDCWNSLGAGWFPTVPDTSLYGANTFDAEMVNYGNSFHWGPLQYVRLSTSDPNSFITADYALGRLRHWAYPQTPATSLLMERAPTPDGNTEGQVTWYDYAGATRPGERGTHDFPAFVAQVLPDGSTAFTHYERDDYGKVTETVATYTKPDGTVGLRTNTYHHAANHFDLEQIVGPTGEQVVSNYFAPGNNFHLPDASYDALNQETKYYYNGYHQLVLQQLPSGLTTSNYYVPSGDGINRLALTADWEIGRTNTYAYYANGLVYWHKDERGLSTTNFWEPLQRLTGVLYPDGTTVSNRYTCLDRTASKDRLDSWSYAGYNKIQKVVAATNANGVITRYGYCDCGSLMSVTNAWQTPVEFVTTYDYDYAGRRTKTFLPDATIANSYNSLDELISTSDGAADTWFYYNNQGLLTNTVTANGSQQITVYDVEDRPIWVTDANSVTIANSYDKLGRLRTRTYPDGGTEHFGYSARGLIAYTNQIGATNFYAYDEAGRKRFETNANWEVIRYTNSPAGDLVALVDGKNQVTKWKYDEYGRVTNKLDQAGTEVLRYKYDANSRLTNRWSVAKGDTKYKYDPLGNLTNIDYAVSTDVKFQYDALDRVKTMIDAAGTTTFTYTLGGQLSTEDGPWSNDTVTNSYNHRLRVGMDLQQPTGVWTNQFGYDAARRLTNVTSKAGSFGYVLASGAPSTLTVRLDLPNTSYITNYYDVNARLLNTTLKHSSHSILNSHSYSYNSANQRTQQVFSPVGSTFNYAYDLIGQLTVADSGTPSEDTGYAYDSAWNLLRRTNNLGVGSVGVDVRNQITSFGGSSEYAYDANGNLRTNWYHAKTYDDENRLIRDSDETYGSYRSDFTYDGLGRLRKRQEYRWVFDETPQLLPQPGHWQSTGGVLYTYDGWRVIQERDLAGTPTVSYTRGTDLSGSLEGAGGIGGMLARSHGYNSGNWTNHNFYHADGNGNITYLVDSSQNLAASYRYDPFGNTLSSSGSLANSNVYRFSSKEFYAKDSLYYYGYRWYSPNLQRWVNRDPIGELGAINLYGFVQNNAMNLIDLHGLSAFGRAWENLRGLGKGACGVAVGYLASKLYFSKQEDARYAHCMVSCRIGELCGNDTAAAAGVAKEFYDLITCAYQGLRTGKWDSPQCQSAFQPSDFVDNARGMSCPKDKSCAEQCADLKGKADTTSGPFYKINEKSVRILIF